MRSKANRRDFLKQTGLAGFGFWVAGGIALADTKSDNEKINFACIGVGGKGSSDTDQAGQFGNIVALCDIDENHLSAKAKKFPNAKLYNDFRKMLEELDKKIDAVTVSTPDHTHAPASVMAMKMGKHVYCQKPLTHDVYEARMMKQIANKHKVATQMGNQGTAHSNLRRAVEIVQAGGIGTVSEAHVWTNRPIWPQAPKVIARPTDTPPVPQSVHWDLFLGPAPERPYNPCYHPFAWRGWWDFGTGALGDMACHTANMPFMALKLQYPTSISAESGSINPETYPGWATVTWEFPARGDLPPVKMFWYEGHKEDGARNLPPQELLKGEKPSDSGSLLVGSKGTLYSPDDYAGQYTLLPKKEFEGFKGPAQTLPRTKGDVDSAMKREWVAAIKGGPPAMSNFDYASLLAETVLLGNVAIRVGKKLEWDGPALKVTNCPEAAQYIQREYRKGWTL
jgi:predicted dehydrogenase